MSPVHLESDKPDKPEVILEKQLFMLNDAAFEAFEQTLQDSPARSNECLQTLLMRSRRWG